MIKVSLTDTEKKAMLNKSKKKTAIWALTPQGALLGALLAEKMDHADLFISEKLKKAPDFSVRFISLSKTLAKYFNLYAGHIFIMSTGIVVRVLAPLIKHKTVDPAAVVIDEAGSYVISLLSGHLGGANAMAQKIAGLIDAEPVITTATDINNLPSIDLIAGQQKLVIENPEAIKTINMAILSGEKIVYYDPMGTVKSKLKKVNALCISKEEIKKVKKDTAFFCIDDVVMDLPENALLLRPLSLVAGIGCNRNTDFNEIKNFFNDTLRAFKLSEKSLLKIATIDLKKDEAGLLKLAEEFQIPIQFYDKKQLGSVKHIQMPSETVKKHIGVNSVCEAAAILATNRGKLIVNKQKKGNVTVAVARMLFT